MGKLTTRLEAGQQVGDTQWSVVRRLGTGAYGVVYECEHRTLCYRAAVKILKPRPGALSKMGQDKAVKAAQMLVKLRHPHLPIVYDADVLPGDLPQMWTAMELLEGEALSEILAREERLSAERALRYALGVARGLTALDELGVIHRDLKPQNIFITHEDEAKVIDFDMARLRGAKTLTGTGQAVGSPYYMAPEAYGEQGHVDKRVDIWSLGVVLYQCLSGRLPFSAKNLPALMAVIFEEEPEPFADELGQELWSLVERALRKDRDERYPDMASFAAAIEAASHRCDLRTLTRTAPLPTPSLPSAHATMRMGLSSNDTHAETRTSAADPGFASTTNPWAKPHIQGEDWPHVAAARNTLWPRTMVAASAVSLVAAGTAAIWLLASPSGSSHSNASLLHPLTPPSLAQTSAPSGFPDATASKSSAADTDRSASAPAGIASPKPLPPAVAVPLLGPPSNAPPASSTAAAVPIGNDRRWGQTPAPQSSRGDDWL